MGYVFTDLAGFRVPDEDAGDDVPADLSFLVEQLDTVTVLKAASVSERDASYYDAPSGVVCVVRDPGTGAVSGAYIKTSNEGSAVWGTIWEPAAALTPVALQLTDPYTTRGTPTYDPGVIKEPGGQFATMTGAVVRIDGTQITSSSVLGYLPSGYLPALDAADYATAVTSSVANSTSTPKVSLTSDGAITYYGSAVNWVGFNSIRYILAPTT